MAFNSPFISQSFIVNKQLESYEIQLGYTKKLRNSLIYINRWHNWQVLLIGTENDRDEVQRVGHEMWKVSLGNPDMVPGIKSWCKE